MSDPGVVRRVRSWVMAAMPAVTFVSGLAITLLMWQAIDRQVNRADQARFQRLNERVLAGARARFESAAQAVYSARAMLIAGGGMSSEQWSGYADATQPYFNEGVVGLGYVERIRRDQIAALEARLRRDSGTEVRIERLGARALLYIVTQVAPAARNAGALGLDIGSGNTRRGAADRAMQSGEPVLTQRIRVIEGIREVPGFLLFLPVYTAGVAPATADERTARLRGWAYASLRIDELTRGLAEAGNNQVDFSIEEDDRPGAPALYATAAAGAAAPEWPRPEVGTLDLYGRKWTFRFTPRPEFTDAAVKALPRVALAAGIAISGLTALLASALLNSRRRAIQLANRMTARLSEANTRLEVSTARAEQSAAEANRASLAKSQFLALMSHEIRTPMNGVIGMTSILLNSPLTLEQREAAETIRASGDALLTIIGDILDFSKIESGNLELEQSAFDLRGCVQGALDLFAPRASAQGIAVSLTIAPEVPPLVVGDAGRLRQVLINLIGNAFKFTSQGQVAVSVRAAAEATGRAVEFAVRDTGIGISPEAASRLFTSFTQVDASTTRKYGGTGLGLAISKRLTELMGGRMWVTSEPGVGSTFTFTIRADAAASLPVPAPLPPDGSPVLARPHKILVAEDNPVNQLVARRMLQGLGCEVDQAVNGVEALAALARQRYDVLLLDVQMPEVDGLEVARRLVAERPRPQDRPWIIGLTANAVQGDRELCLQAGMDDYLTKPVKSETLAGALERAKARRVVRVRD